MKANKPLGRALRQAEAGMTLIEIMVVVAIIALVVGGVSVFAFGQFKKAQIKSTKQMLGSVESGLEMYMMDNKGQCPKDLDDLHEQKILKSKPRDAWGNKFIMKCPGEINTDTADIASKGPDKKENTKDDIKNFQE